MVRLSVEKAAKLKADIASAGGRNQAKIAKANRVSRSTVSDIMTGRIHSDVAWPEGYEPVPNKRGGQRKVKDTCDPTNDRILELESELLHVTEERNRIAAKYKASAKTDGLFRAITREMDTRIKPFSSLPGVYKFRKSPAIVEHVVLHLSDMHADQVVRPEECGGLEQYDFPIACARAERLTDTVIEFTQQTLAPRFHFPDLWILANGDFTSGEIHGHGHRSYYRNQMKNCMAIGQLMAFMYRDLAPHFARVHVVCLSGNHGRRSTQKDHHGAHDNFDYLCSEIARLHCRDLENVSFLIPDAFSVNLDINGIGVNLSHGDDVKGSLGLPFYGLVRRQKNLIALASAQVSGPTIRYTCVGHHHVYASMSDVKGEVICNGAWLGTDAYAYNSFAGYREPCQLLHGIHARNGVTWRLPIKLRHASELNGPKRYKIDGGRDVGPLL